MSTIGIYNEKIQQSNHRRSKYAFYDSHVEAARDRRGEIRGEVTETKCHIFLCIYFVSMMGQSE